MARTKTDMKHKLPHIRLLTTWCTNKYIRLDYLVMYYQGIDRGNFNEKYKVLARLYPNNTLKTVRDSWKFLI